MIHFDKYVSNGLKPPTSMLFFSEKETQAELVIQDPLGFLSISPGLSDSKIPDHSQRKAEIVWHQMVELNRKSLKFQQKPE